MTPADHPLHTARPACGCPGTPGRRLERTLEGLLRGVQEDGLAPSPGNHRTCPASWFGAWTATLGGMKWRAFWAGVKHDVGALQRRKADGEGYIPAWDPSIPKRMSSYGPGSWRAGGAADTADE